jgi:hypothetical protein
MRGEARPSGARAARTASAPVLIRAGVDEDTGAPLSAAVVAERVGWCAALVGGMAGRLLGEHWNTGDVAALESGAGPDGRPLPPAAWMALRRLGWNAVAPAGVVVNDRVVRMTQEQAGRVLRSAAWRAALVAGLLATWPADPGSRTAQEWDAARAAVPGGQHLPSSVIRARTRQVVRFLAANGRMPAGVFALEPPRGAGFHLNAHATPPRWETTPSNRTPAGAGQLRITKPIRDAPMPRRRPLCSWT